MQSSVGYWWGWEIARVISHRDFEYLLSMADGVPYHLGLCYCCNTPPSSDRFLGRSYFCKTIHHSIGSGMNLLGGVGRKRLVGGFIPFTRVPFWAMGIPLSAVYSLSSLGSTSPHTSLASTPSSLEYSLFNPWLGRVFSISLIIMQRHYQRYTIFQRLRHDMLGRTHQI